VGRIVLFAPSGSALDPTAGLAGLARLVAGGGVRRFAIANPEHAPYGRAAEAALKKHGLWTALQPHLVLGENVTQAAQFATTGNAAGGIIAYSLALAPNLQGRGRYALIPADDHPPLRQRMVLTSRAGPVAQRFYDYMQTPPARANSSNVTASACPGSSQTWTGRPSAFRCRSVSGRWPLLVPVGMWAGTAWLRGRSAAKRCSKQLSPFRCSCRRPCSGSTCSRCSVRDRRSARPRAAGRRLLAFSFPGLCSPRSSSTCPS
jgi:hypothetical protein